MFLSNTHSFYYYQSKFLFLSKKYANNINNYSLFKSIIHYIKRIILLLVALVDEDLGGATILFQNLY